MMQVYGYVIFRYLTFMMKKLYNIAVGVKYRKIFSCCNATVNISNVGILDKNYFLMKITTVWNNWYKLVYCLS